MSKDHANQERCRNSLYVLGSHSPVQFWRQVRSCFRRLQSSHRSYRGSRRETFDYEGLLVLAQWENAKSTDEISITNASNTLSLGAYSVGFSFLMHQRKRRKAVFLFSSGPPGVSAMGQMFELWADVAGDFIPTCSYGDELEFARASNGVAKWLTLLWLRRRQSDGEDGPAGWLWHDIIAPSIILCDLITAAISDHPLERSEKEIVKKSRGRKKDPEVQSRDSKIRERFQSLTKLKPKAAKQDHYNALSHEFGVSSEVVRKAVNPQKRRKKKHQ